MTNDKARRASGKAMQDARRSGGKAMQDSRRAGGDAMIERRTGKSQVDEINSVVVQPKARKTIKAITPRGPLPAQTSPGTDTPNPKPAGGGGIASPLTEQPGTREQYPPALRPSTDGAVFFAVSATKRITMTDANGAEVVMEFANVTA